MLPHLHPHLLRLRVPAALLTLVYLAAVAVGLGAPGEHTTGVLVVLAGLAARWALRTRRSARTCAPVAGALAGTAEAVDAVLGAQPVPAPSSAAAA